MGRDTVTGNFRCPAAPRGRVNNQRGVALVLALAMAAIGLSLGAAVIYMVKQSTVVSGLERRYATALGAAKGAVAMATLMINQSTEEEPYDPDDVGSFVRLPCGGPAGRTLYKLINPTSMWGAAPACTEQYDMIVNPNLDSLGPPDQQFRIYVTITDTIFGNRPFSPQNMRITGVVNTGAVLKNPSNYPRMYRIDVHSERPNPVDPANPVNPYDINRRPLDVADITLLYAN